MERRQRLFIYDRKEIVVLILLGALVAVFAFTLGIHLGKRVGPKGAALAPSDAVPVATQRDAEPSRQDVTEQAKAANSAADDAMSQALHEEVQKTGLQLQTPKPVELPETAKNPKGGATTAASGESGDKAKETEPVKPSHAGHFTLQVGSYRTVGEARGLREALESHGLKPVVRSANLGEKGTWHRVFVGSFESVDQAEQMGNRYKTQKIVESFVVAKSPE